MSKADIKKMIANKKQLIKLKKATLKKCDVIELSSAAEITSKGMTDKNDNENEIYRTIVGNTYGFMDSHQDVHIKGIFTKSIQENKENILHLHDHVHQLSAKVGTPLDTYEKEVSWSEVGLNKSGTTTALLMDSKIERSRNKNIFLDYKNGAIKQHSVGMQYVKIELAVNDPEEKEEFATWEKYKNEVINLDLAEETGYFWAVTEAKLIEISCVIRGSNELTPTLDASKGLEELTELNEKALDNPTKENLLHFCNQFKALQEGEAVNKTLPKVEKPQKKINPLFNHLTQLK